MARTTKGPVRKAIKRAISRATGTKGRTKIGNKPTVQVTNVSVNVGKKRRK